MFVASPDVMQSHAEMCMCSMHTVGSDSTQNIPNTEQYISSGQLQATAASMPLKQLDFHAKCKWQAMDRSLLKLLGS